MFPSCPGVGLHYPETPKPGEANLGALIDWLLGRQTEDRELWGLNIASVQIAPGVRVPITEVGAGAGVAARLPAVYRARLMIINTVGQLPVITPDPDNALLRRPDPELTRQEWVRQSVASLIDDGNLYWRTPSTGGQTIAIQVADPADVVTTWDNPRLRRRYRWRGVDMTHGRDLWHIAMGRGPGELTGKGPMNHRRLPGVWNALNFIEEFYGNGGHTHGTLEHPQELDDGEAQALLDRWIAAHPPGTRNPGILSGGLTWNPGGPAPKDADWVATHGAGILDVAQIFGVPARLLGYSQPGSSITYGNVQDVYLSWWRESLQTDYVAPIEEAWSEIAGVPVEFDPWPLIRGDVGSRFAAYAAGVASGVLTVDEARELEGRPPLRQRMREDVT